MLTQGELMSLDNAWGEMQPSWKAVALLMSVS